MKRGGRVEEGKEGQGGTVDSCNSFKLSGVTIYGNVFTLCESGIHTHTQAHTNTQTHTYMNTHTYMDTHTHMHMS